MPRKPEFVASPVVVAEPPGEKLCDHGVRFAERCAECEAVLGSPMPESWAAKAPMGKPRIDALPNVPYAEGTFEPGTHETPARIVEVPTVTGPSMEALGERRAQLRANLGHARNSVKGADDSRAVAAENSLRRFDESGDGIRLRLFCRRGLEESAWACPASSDADRAIDACLAYSNGREFEWGSRAEAAFEYLHNHVAKRSGK